MAEKENVKLSHAKFSNGIKKINKQLNSNVLASEHRSDQEYIMPINLFVTRDRNGLIKVWREIKRLIVDGYVFEKI